MDQAIKRLQDALRHTNLKRNRRPFRLRTIVIGRMWVTAGILLLAGAVIFGLFSNPAVVGAAAAERLLPIYCVGTKEKKIALSFDAAWGAEDTPALIDILNTYGVHATFFLVGDWVDQYPDAVAALAEAGEEVMNHSNKHKHMPQLSREDILSDIRSCNTKIEEITGVTPSLFRAPYGEYDDKLVAAVTSLGMQTIQWDVDSLDWKDLSAADITQRVLSRVAPGSIVLFHNAAKHTPEALPGIIEALLADGYTIVPVGELLLQGDYTINHEGRQIAAGS